MVALVAVLLAAVTWALFRRLLAGEPRGPEVAPWAGTGSRAAWALCLAAVIATQIPLLRAVSPLLISDACGHAAIAAYLAREGAAPTGGSTSSTGASPSALTTPPWGGSSRPR